MRKFLALLNVSLRSMLVAGGGKGRGRRKKNATGAGAAVLIAGLGMYISGVYSTLLMTALAPINMEILVFIFMGLAALFGGLMFTAFGASAALYGGKDNDLMLSLPVSSTTLMAARISAIYIENLLFSFFMLLPAGVACMILTESGVGQSVGFWIRMLLAAFLLPMLDTALSVLVGALIAWLSGKMKHRAIGQNLLTGVYLAAVFWFSFSLSGMIENLTMNAHSVLDGMSWAAPMVWMGKGILGDWTKLAAFAAACVIPCALVIWILGKTYRRAVSSFKAASARSDYRLSAQRSSGQIKALVSKEAKRLFGTPAYLWNCGLGLLMLVVLGVFAVVKRNMLLMLLGLEGLQAYVLPAACAVMGFCLSMSAVCAFSVSLEGKYLWLLQSAPIDERRLLGIKTGFQIGLAAPFIIISSVLLGIALKLSSAETLMLLAFGLLFECFDAVLDMLLGLWFARPELDDAAIIKRSLLSFLANFLPMIFLGLVGVLVWQLWVRVGMAAAMMGMYVALAAALGICSALLHRKGPQLFRSL